MNISSRIRALAVALAFVLCAAMLLAPELRSTQSSGSNAEKAADPWTSAQVLHAAEFAGELGSAKGADSPIIFYVGFHTLFEGGHIPGASFYGTASKEEGLTDLKKSVVALPRLANLVIYCGCCPFDKCPNIRPAYKALNEMGFSHVRVLVLPTSFAADWVEKGYPMQKGFEKVNGTLKKPM
jgi:thiosulfate/3-mercaptopyruvate sulfurtransferase